MSQYSISLPNGDGWWHGVEGIQGSSVSRASTADDTCLRVELQMGRDRRECLVSHFRDRICKTLQTAKKKKKEME